MSSFYSKIKHPKNNVAGNMSTIRQRLACMKEKTMSDQSIRPNAAHKKDVYLTSTQNIIVYNTPNFAMKDITNEQQRILEHVDTITRRMNDIETNIDQYQFQTLQKQLSNGLYSPGGDLEYLERDINTKFDDLMHEIDQLKNLSSKLNSNLQQSITFEKIQHQIEEIEESMKRSMASTKSMATDHVDMKDKLSNVASVVSSLTNQISDVSKSNEGVINVNQLYEDFLNIMNDKISTLLSSITTEISDVSSTVAKTKEEVASSITCLSNQVSDVSSTVAKTKEEVASSITCLSNQVSDVSSTVAKTKEEVASSITCLSNQVSDVSSTVAKTKEEVASSITCLSNAVDRCGKDVQSTKNETSEVGKQILDVASLLFDTRYDVASLVSETADISSSIINSKSEIANVISSMTITKSDVASSVSNITSKIADISNYMTIHASEIAFLKKELISTQLSISDQVKTMKTNINGLISCQQFKKEIESKELVLEGIQHQIDYMTTLYRGKQQCVSDIESEIVKLKLALDSSYITDNIQPEISRLIRDEINREKTDGLLQAEMWVTSDKEKSLSINQLITYKKQVQDLTCEVNEIKKNSKLSSISSDQLEKCNSEIQKVESQLILLLSEFDVMNQERIKTDSMLNYIKLHIKEFQTNQDSLKMQHGELLTRMEPIIEMKNQMNELKSEFTNNSSIQSLKIENVCAQLEKTVQEQNHILQQNIDLSELCMVLDNEYKAISENFKEQYDILQKRYQQLHTIIVSNMEETERGNQNVRDLVDIHTRIEKDYKSITNAYEKQQEDFNKSLKERDARLKVLEDKLKQKGVGAVSGIGSSKLSTRLEELSQPKRIQESKNSSS
jgi:chromosome segregation ATPase